MAPVLHSKTAVGCLVDLQRVAQSLQGGVPLRRVQFTGGGEEGDSEGGEGGVVVTL